MFVDEAEIYVRSGNGGPGCISFRREKFVAKGGPDGGDGGDGGSVIFKVDPQLNTLTRFSGKHHWIAENGRPGGGSNCSGKAGCDLVIRVPPGTLLFDRDNGLRLKDLTGADQEVIILKGGVGGLGNRHYATPTRQTPRFATPGRPGGERWLRLELKLIADVGLIGMPNAGKSTLLARTTRARPKIADYPFTTLVPQLGIVELQGFRHYVMADIPGLIEGAHEGIGLGDAFLKHIERTRILVHLLDILPLEGEPTAAAAYHIVREELAKYSPELATKPQIVVANKMDLVADPQPLRDLESALDRPVFGISAVTGFGLERFHKKVWACLQAAPDGVAAARAVSGSDR